MTRLDQRGAVAFTGRGCRGDPANHPLGIFVLEDDAPPNSDSSLLAPTAPANAWLPATSERSERRSCTAALAGGRAKSAGSRGGVLRKGRCGLRTKVRLRHFLVFDAVLA